MAAASATWKEIQRGLI
ncbi:MAG: hypothetical protein EZS28_020620, partial [Streblomastix strix]